MSLECRRRGWGALGGGRVVADKQLKYIIHGVCLRLTFDMRLCLPHHHLGSRVHLLHLPLSQFVITVIIIIAFCFSNVYFETFYCQFHHSDLLTAALVPISCCCQMRAAMQPWPFAKDRQITITLIFTLTLTLMTSLGWTIIPLMHVFGLVYRRTKRY